MDYLQAQGSKLNVLVYCSLNCTKLARGNSISSLYSIAFNSAGGTNLNMNSISFYQSLPSLKERNLFDIIINYF